MVWQRALGDSHGMPAIDRGRLFVFDRHKDMARLVCLKSETGEHLWTFETPTDYEDRLGYGDGPRCSPVVDGDRVYVLGADGLLVCVSVLDGTEIWRVDYKRRFGVQQYLFGIGSTPVIEGDLLIALVGGSAGQENDSVNLSVLQGNGTGIVAFNKYNGRVHYAVSDALASYASPKFATIGGRRWGFAFARGRLVGFEPVTGTIDFEFPWQAKFNAAVSAANPVVVGDEVFITEAYGPGSCLLEVQPGKAEVIWQDDPELRAKAMKSHWNTPIFHEGYLYGCSGRRSYEARLRCVDWKTGRVVWKTRSKGLSSLLYVDGHFLVMGEYGDLDLVRATSEKYTLVARLTLREDPDDPESAPLLKYPAWSAPVLSRGLLYLRGKDRLVCLDLIPASTLRSARHP
ncbi:MAG: PQQ-binding-like beta-propeller repeat protein [Verrucomicrobiota bacterium]